MICSQMQVIHTLRYKTEDGDALSIDIWSDGAVCIQRFIKGRATNPDASLFRGSRSGLTPYRLEADEVHCQESE